MTRHLRNFLAVLALVTLAFPAAAEDDTFTPEEIMDAATGLFGATSEGLATVVQKAFSELGEPNAYIAGEEISGAFFVGVRYGKGELNRKSGPVRQVYWQGPSVGFDFGGNAAKVFTLVYHLKNNDDLFQRIPGVDGSFYFVAGVGMNYQQAGDLILAPIRTGVGLRFGANAGYLEYTKEHSWIPF